MRITRKHIRKLILKEMNLISEEEGDEAAAEDLFGGDEGGEETDAEEGGDEEAAAEDDAEAGDEDVFRKVKADLIDHNISDEDIRKNMDELNEKAKSEFM